MIALALDSYHVVFLVLTIFIVFATYRLLRRPNHLPVDIPWVGGFNTSFERLLAPYQALFRGREFLDEAYYKFGKLDRICVIPNIFENRIALPSSYMDWIERQPPRNVACSEPMAETISGIYTLRTKVTEKPAFSDVVRRQFKRHLDELTPDLMDEISFSMDQFLGLDTNRYKSVNVYGTIQQIVARTANRVIVGQPLCRNVEYIENAIRYVDFVPSVGFLIRLLPGRLIPVIGRALSQVNRFVYLKCARTLSPPFLELMRRWQVNADVATNELPNNWLTWSVDEIMRSETHKTADKKLRWLTRILMNLEFTANNTTTLATTHFLLNVFSSPVGQHCVDDLVTECKTLNGKFGSEWNRARMTEMVTMDSALRESMRLSPVTTTSNARRVVAPNGLILPDDTWIPCGSFIETAAYSVHHDEISPHPLYAIERRRNATQKCDHNRAEFFILGLW